MLAETLTIGDEICRGEIVDTNASWLAGELWGLDVTVAWMTSCRDLKGDLVAALERASRRTALIVATGGLGPTEDDLTVDVVCELVGANPVAHPPSLERMKARYARVGFELTENNMRQVRVPEGARVFQNPVGLAPGFEIPLGSARVICLPGPPRELHALWESEIAGRVVELREAEGEVERIARETFRVFGRGESHVAAALVGIVDDHPGASIHYQVKFPETLVKLVVRDRDGAAASNRLNEISATVRAKLGNDAYGVGEDSLAAAVGRALVVRSQTVATAESCTGGMVGSAITAVAGSSDYYAGGVITYSNAEKERQLGVSAETLATHGAVSEECVVAMAAAVRERVGTDWGIAISGIAGPGGGTEEKPVGTVWLAVCGPDQRQKARRLSWPGARDQVRTLATHAALKLLLGAILSDGEEL